MYLKQQILMILLIATAFICPSDASKNHKPVVTMVTGLWDVGRGELNSKFKRTFEYYLDYFSLVLKTDANLIVFGDTSLKQFVRTHRNQTNTMFIQKQMDWFKSRWYTPKMKSVIEYCKKNSQKWDFYSTTAQYGLEMYNPVLFSKLFMMTQATHVDIFGSDYYVWLDAGLIHVEDKDLFVPNNVLQKWPLYFQGSWIYHSVQDNPLKQGFINQGKQYINNRSLTESVWGGYFGGRVQAVSSVKGIFQNFVRISLQKNEMWTQESLYSMMVQRFPYIVHFVHKVSLNMLQNFTIYNPTYRQVQEQRELIIDLEEKYNNCQNSNQITVTKTIIKPINLQDASMALKGQFIFKYISIMNFDMFCEILSTACLLLALCLIVGCTREFQKNQNQSLKI